MVLLLLIMIGLISLRKLQIFSYFLFEFLIFRFFIRERVLQLPYLGLEVLHLLPGETSLLSVALELFFFTIFLIFRDSGPLLVED